MNLNNAFYFQKYAATFVIKTISLMHTRTHTRTEAVRVSLHMGIKLHVENADGCVGAHGSTRTVQQLFVFAHACAL